MSTAMKIIFYCSCLTSISSATICKPIFIPIKGYSPDTLPRLLNNFRDFFQNNHRRPPPVNTTNICVYSSNPDKFKPKCFLCPSDAYPNIRQVCSEKEQAENSTNEIYWDQATCIEKNCQIILQNYPRSSNSQSYRVGRVASGETNPNSYDGSTFVSPSYENNQNLYPQTATSPCDSLLISESHPRIVTVSGKEYAVTRCEINFIKG